MKWNKLSYKTLILELGQCTCPKLHLQRITGRLYIVDRIAQSCTICEKLRVKGTTY